MLYMYYFIYSHNNLAEKIGFSPFYRRNCSSEGLPKLVNSRTGIGICLSDTEAQNLSTVPRAPGVHALCVGQPTWLERVTDFLSIGKDQHSLDPRPQEPTQQKVQVPA